MPDKILLVGHCAVFMKRLKHRQVRGLSDGFKQLSDLYKKKEKRKENNNNSLRDFFLEILTNKFSNRNVECAAFHASLKVSP